MSTPNLLKLLLINGDIGVGELTVWLNLWKCNVLLTESYQWGSDSGEKFWGNQADVDGNKLGNNTCNILKGTDGNQFPPGVQKENPLWIFNPAPCRCDQCFIKTNLTY